MLTSGIQAPCLEILCRGRGLTGHAVYMTHLPGLTPVCCKCCVLCPVCNTACTVNQRVIATMHHTLVNVITLVFWAFK